MPKLLHTFTCPIEELPFELVIDLGLSQSAYLAGLRANDYLVLADIPNWEAVMDGTPKPLFPLTGQTMDDVPLAFMRYMTSGQLVDDALDDFTEKRSPNSRTR